MKVASAQLPATTPSTATAAAGADPAPAIAPGEPHPGARMHDGFDPTRGRPTLSRGDRRTASRLEGALESPFNGLLASLPWGKQTLKYDQRSGVWRGPQGQPLVNVQLKNGISAYVDPSTNKYYLAKDMAFAQAIGVQPRLRATGPLSLPPGARFSPSHFSAADARELTRIARGHGYEQVPQPRPDHARAGGTPNSKPGLGSGDLG